MGIRRIPTEPYPNTTQQCDLDGVTYSLRFRWSARGACWHMDIRTLDDEPVLLSARLVTSYPLLWRSLNPHRPPGDLMLLDMTGRDENATLEGFGTRFRLYYFEVGS